LSRWVRDRIVANNPDKVIWMGHSFGGAYSMFFVQWLAHWYSGPGHDNPPFKIDAFVLFDPVPNGLRFGEGQGDGWIAPSAVALRQLCFYQRDGFVVLIKGVPLAWEATAPVGSVENVDVSSWRNPQLGHIDWLLPRLTCLIKDARVQAQTLALADQVLA
jgi:pimeloyl-ACP methyl ester carboxylesterase